MARPIVLSNGELHVGINRFGLVHDFYFPYVGLENHAAGQSLRHRIGVWVDGAISWLDDGAWVIDFSYPHQALVGHIVARNEAIGIMLEFDDIVDSEMSAFIRNIHVINMRETERDLRLFLHQAFVIGDSRSNTDTVQYLPDIDAVLHYRGRRAFIVSALDENIQPFDQYTVGLFDIEGHEGTFRDADDGELSMCPVEHGRVDSTIRFKMKLAPHSSYRVHYWIAAGTSTREAIYIHKQMVQHGIDSRLDKTAKWWQDWLKPAIKVAEKIDPAHRDTFLKSTMLLKSQIDKRGAVIASSDTSRLNYERDTYAYCWPRDAAYAIWPLIRMGYTDEPHRFFEFCRRGLHPGGYLMHKYRADGALGSSWHPYLHENGVVSPPIQEDETALVLFVFSQYYHMHPSEQLLKEFYEPFVLPMANFLSAFIDKRTGLPKPSYDLWENIFLTTTYTTSLTYAALLAAADLAETSKDSDSAVRWRSTADDIATAARKLLFNKDRGLFYKGLMVNDDGTIEYNSTFDVSSIFGSFMYGLFSVESDETKSAVETLEKLCGVSGDSHGVPRYENDFYLRAHDDTMGNWWFITSLWLAQYYIETGKNDKAKLILDWVRDQADTTGVLSEQIDPKTHEKLSVAPLSWSQAEYVSTLLDTITD